MQPENNLNENGGFRTIYLEFIAQEGVGSKWVCLLAVSCYVVCERVSLRNMSHASVHSSWKEVGLCCSCSLRKGGICPAVLFVVGCNIKDSYQYPGVALWDWNPFWMLWNGAASATCLFLSQVWRASSPMRPSEVFCLRRRQFGVGCWFSPSTHSCCFSSFDFLGLKRKCGYFLLP